MNELVALLKRHGLSISSVESFTGGLFGAHLSEVPGVSAVYRGTLTAYSESVKCEWLGLDHNWLISVGTISAACAKAMAIQGQHHFHSEVCVAFTGNAGPTTQENQPLGQWYACIVIRDRVIELSRVDSLERNTLRENAVNVVTQVLLEALREVGQERIHP